MKILIVLGNKLKDNGDLSDDLTDRLCKAVELEENFDIILLSGGATNSNVNATEAKTMQDFLVDKGVEEAKLVLEDMSLTTKQNALFSAPIIEKVGADEIAVLSSSAHIKRLFFNPIRLFKHYTGCKVSAIGV